MYEQLHTCVRAYAYMHNPNKQICLLLKKPCFWKFTMVLWSVTICVDRPSMYGRNFLHNTIIAKSSFSWVG